MDGGQTSFMTLLQNYGIQMGIDMCRELLERGAPGLHMYTLNLEKSAVAILEGLGVIDRNNISRYDDVHACENKFNYHFHAEHD